MRSENRERKARKSLITSVLLLTSALTATAQPLLDASPEAWIHSPYRNFGPAQTILPGRAIGLSMRELYVIAPDESNR